MPKSGGRKGRPQGCSLRSHRLRRLTPLTPTLSPATHSAMPCMLPCCTSDLNRRGVMTELNTKRSVRISRTTLSCSLRPKGYGTLDCSGRRRDEGAVFCQPHGAQPQRCGDRQYLELQCRLLESSTRSKAPHATATPLR